MINRLSDIELKMIHLLLAVLLCVSLHLLAMAAAGRAWGVTIRALSVGFGPPLLTVGMYRLGAIPLGGFVKFLDSREEDVPPEAMCRAFDGQTTLAQVSIALSGCTALLLVALCLQGASGLHAFLEGPLQILGGAASPLNAGQALLDQAAAQARSDSFGGTLAVVAAKMAAFNLLPFPALNGGAAVAILAHRLGIARWWPAWVTKLLMIAFLVGVTSWALAIISHLTAA